MIRSTMAFKTSCMRAAAMICLRPGLQRKPAAAALSQAGRVEPDQPIRAIQPAGRTRRPPTRCTRQTSDRRQTDRRQTASSLNAPRRGITSCARSDTICPRPSTPPWAPKRLARRQADAVISQAVVSHAQYVLTVTAPPTSRVKAAVSKAAW